MWINIGTNFLNYFDLLHKQSTLLIKKFIEHRKNFNRKTNLETFLHLDLSAFLEFQTLKIYLEIELYL